MDSKDSAVPIKVLSLGMSRTGTASMKKALQILGHDRVHHAYELYAEPQQADKWLAAWEAKRAGKPFDRAAWDEILGPYSAVTDMPAVCFAPELVAAYPEAKVVLVERDVDGWYRSFDSGVIDTFWSQVPTTRILSVLDPQLMKPIHALWHRLFGTKEGYFRASSRAEMQANSKDVYAEHYAVVRRVTPKERLLEYDLKQGWGPLCDFLDVEPPNEPFPRVNEGDAVKEVVQEFVRRSMLNVLRNIGIGAAMTAVAVAGWYLY